MGGVEWLALSVFLVFVTPRYSLADEGDEIPLIGRPADLPFSQASAGFETVEHGTEYRVPFRLETRAFPVEVEELAEVRLTVRIESQGRVEHPPQRVDLRQVPAFTQRFYIEDLTDGKKSKNDARAWHWVYRLRPRSCAVTEVPGVPLVFYNPDVQPKEKGFQILWSDPIPLRVQASEVQAPPVEMPELLIEFVTGPKLLERRAAPWPGPGKWLLGTSLLGPPLGCWLWCLWWRYRHPDAARVRRRQQSRAARLALARLDRAERQAGKDRAEKIAEALAGYLSDRWGLPSREPTPIEVCAWLTKQGIEEARAEELAQLLRDCAAWRFGPQGAESKAIASEVRRWIMSMEER